MKRYYENAYKNHKKRTGDTAQCWITCLKYTGLDQIHSQKKKVTKETTITCHVKISIRVMKFSSTAALRSQWRSHFGKAWQTFIKLNIHSLYTVIIPFLTCYFCFCFFPSAGNQSQVLTHAKQELYHWTMTKFPLLPTPSSLLRQNEKINKQTKKTNPETFTAV